MTVTVTAAQASLYFIHPDHLGTPRLVTDAANAIVWRNLPTTEPFGKSPPEEDPNGTGTRFEMPLAFPGQYRDRESNSNYNFYRDLYFPDQGRYGQSDPIGLQGPVKESREAQSQSPRFPAEPQENILYFIEKNAPLLEPWQREIVRIVRKISQYFYPQRQTQVMNEGWATFWHYTILNKLYDEGLVTDGFYYRVFAITH